MAVRLSRQEITKYFADEYIKDSKDIVRQLAAYLIDTKRTRELSIIVRDIEYHLMKKGVIVADVVSARELDQATRKQIEELVRGKDSKSSVYLRDSVDSSLIGGIKIETPESVLDMTIRHKLMQLKANKIY